MRIFLQTFLICLFSCKSSSKQDISSSLPQTDGISNSIAKQVFSPPEVILTYYSLGNYKIPYFTVLSPEVEPHHYQYRVCSESGECINGNYLWGGRLLAGLKIGNHTLKIKACANEPNFCGKPSKVKFFQKANSDSKLTSLILAAKEISTEIRAGGEIVHTLLSSELNKNHTGNSDLIEQQLHLSETVSGELLNSPNFYKNYQSRIKNERVESFSPSLEALERRILELEGKASDNSDSSGSYSAGEMVIISLGSISFVAGAILVGVGVATPSLVKSLSGEINSLYGAGGNNEALLRDLQNNLEKLKLTISNLDGHTVVDKIRKMLHSPAGYVSYLNPEALQKGHIFVKIGDVKDIENGKYKIYRVPEGTETVEPSNDSKTIEIGDNYYPADKVERYVIDHKAVYLELDVPGDIKSFAKNYDQNGFRYELNEDEGIKKITKTPINADGSLDIAKASSYYFIGDNNRYFIKNKYPLSRDEFPDFNEDTIKRLYERKRILVTGGDPAKSIKDKYGVNSVLDNNWAKGVPLYDTSGRLVQPPQMWQVAGVNWYYDPSIIKRAVDRANNIAADGMNKASSVLSYVGSFFTESSEESKEVKNPPPPEGFKIIPKDDHGRNFYYNNAGDLKMTPNEDEKKDYKLSSFDADDIKSNNLYEIKYETQSWFRPIAGNIDNTKINSLLSLEFLVKYYEFELDKTVKHKSQVVVNNLDKIKVSDYKKSIHTRSEKARKNIIGLGSILGVLGAGAIITTASLGLTSSSELNELAKKTYALHKQRLGIVYKIKKYLGDNSKFNLEKDGWIFQL